jgi:hypothetical protein
MGHPPAPDWAELLGDAGYAAFRAALITALADMQIVVDELHIDHGVLHTPSGEAMGLSNVVRLCHAAPRHQWPTLIVDHLRRATAKPAPLSFSKIADKLRVRITPERLIEANPQAYVSRDLAPGLRVTLAVDLPEHVVFVKPTELDEWGQSADQLFERALANTEAEEALEQHDIELQEAPSIAMLVGGSYFAASHVLFLERYVPHHPNGVLIGLPDRHALAVLPLLGTRSISAFGPMVRLASARFAEEPGAITDQLYWKRGTLWMRVACGVRDDGTPWVAPPDEFNDLVSRLSRAE